MDCKLCKKCGETKACLEFYHRPSAKDGLRGWCKDCEKASVKIYQTNSLFRLQKKESAKRYNSSEKGRASNLKRSKDYYLKNRKRCYARSLLGFAIKSGKIHRLSCEKCGNKASEAHHADYNKPLEVTWLCKKHHWEWHKNNEPIY